jgi:hypothetical protein
MKPFGGAIAITLGCCLSILALTGQVTAQRARAPLAPGDFQDFRPPQEALVPPFTYVPIPSDEVDIRNIGNAELTFSYWDAEDNGAWHTLAIEPGQTISVQCPKCKQTITISFHNGKETKEQPVPLGNEFQLRWSSQQNVWDLAPSPSQRGRIVPREPGMNPLVNG